MLLLCYFATHTLKQRTHASYALARCYNALRVCFSFLFLHASQRAKNMLTSNKPVYLSAHNKHTQTHMPQRAYLKRFNRTHCERTYVENARTLERINPPASSEHCLESRAINSTTTVNNALSDAINTKPPTLAAHNEKRR